MLIKVNLYALGVKNNGEKHLNVNISDQSKVKDILEHFNLLGKNHIITVVNSKRCQLDYPLQDGDVVKVFPVLEGG